MAKKEKYKCFSTFAQLCKELENISSGNLIREKLSDFFSKTSSESVRYASYFLLGSAGPKYKDTDLGIGDKTAVKILADSFNKKENEVEKKFGKKGDLGDVAEKISKRKRGSLSLEEVYKGLRDAKRAEGEGSQSKKISCISELIKNSSALESKYIMRIVLGSMRLGVGEMTIIDAFAEAFAQGKESRSEIEESYNVCTDIGRLGESLSKKGMSSAKRFSISLGRPVKSMLAKRVKKVSDIIKKIKGETFSAEEKYDGERVQIHKDGKEIMLFSRQLEDITSQYPDIVKYAKKSIKSGKAVLDGEIVAFKDGKQMFFSRLMQRRRKYDVEKYADKIPVAVFLFDILYINGKSKLKTAYPERRKILEKAVRQTKHMKLAVRKTSKDIKDIKDFFNSSVKKGFEGIIVKSTSEDSFYNPGKRGWLWIKWKKDYQEGMQDSFDCAVIGSFQGKGKRKEVFGSLLCAVYNRKKDRYESFTKVGAGFTEKEMDKINKELEKEKSEEKPNNVEVKSSMKPDKYYNPKIVIEIIGAEITLSPSHSAGEKDGKGLALRFPRFVRVRKDKAVSDCTTVKEIKSLRGKK